MDIGRLHGMGQRSDGNAIDTGHCVIPDIVQGDPSRGLERNSAGALDDGVARLIRCEVIQKYDVRPRMNGFFELIEVRHLNFQGRSLPQIFPGLGKRICQGAMKRQMIVLYQDSVEQSNPMIEAAAAGNYTYTYDAQRPLTRRGDLLITGGTGEDVGRRIGIGSAYTYY